MFADPYMLEKDEKTNLVTQLRECVARFPEVSELRVLLGMALCVNFDVHSAIEELNESVRLAPNSFIAQLKLGELWMRLRVCDKAEEHTRIASLLAQNLAQSDLARKQAANLRIMKREGIERGGYNLHSQELVLCCAGYGLGRQRPLPWIYIKLIVQHVAGLQLALLVAILLPAGKLCASLFSRVGIPPILGELVVGVILGPGALNLLHMHLFAGGQASSALMLLAQVGGFVLMFIAGLETDIDRMREASMSAFVVALSGVIWPFFLVPALAISLGFRGPLHVSLAAH